MAARMNIFASKVCTSTKGLQVALAKGLHPGQSTF